MAIRKKSEVLASVKIETNVLHGRTYRVWRAFLGSSREGKTIRIAKSSRAELEQAVDKFYSELAASGEGITSLTPAQVYDAQTALKRLADAGLAITLTQLANEYASANNAENAEKPIETAFNEYFQSIPEIQSEQRRCVMARVRPFVQAVGPSTKCGEVSAAMVQDYLKSLGDVAPKTWNNKMSYVKTFLNWCAKRSHGYMKENPIVDLEMRPIAYSEPEYMSVADVNKLFCAAREEGNKPMLAFLALSFFAGMRHAEILRLAEDVSDYRPDAGTVIVRMPKGWTKGVTPRAFQLEDNCQEWLVDAGEWKAIEGINEMSVKYWLPRLFKRAGLKAKHNAGRHSFITYHAALYSDPTKTATICGTSKKMMAAHYMGLCDKRQGQEYFSILPNT